MKVTVRPLNSYYSLTHKEADELKAIVGLPTTDRACALRKYGRQHSMERLAYLFAQFIGLANSVETNARDFLEVAAIVDGNVHPHSTDQLNMPSILGALQGVAIAIEPVKGMCGGCAYRLGTHANQSVCTTTDAKDALENPHAFMCHNELDEDGEPTAFCAGFQNRRAQIEAAVKQVQP